MTKVTNPLTNRKISLEGPTARRLLQQGSVIQAGDRLLRPAHAALEEEAARLGLPEPVWRFPPATDPDTIARVAEAVEALARARRAPGPQPAQPRPLENPLTDEEVDAALDDGNAPQARAQRDGTGAITWQTGAPGHANEQVPDLLLETPDTLYTLRVDGAQYTWPGEGDNGPVAVSGVQLAEDPDTFAAIEEALPEGTPIVFAPIETAPRLDYPQAGSVSFRSYNSAPLRAPADNDPRVVQALEALDPDRRYLLYFNQGLMDGQLSPLSWSETAARDMRMAAGAQRHNNLRGADVSAAFLYDVDRVMYEKFRYVGVVVYELRPVPEADPDAPPGPFNHGERPGELLNCVMRALALQLREKKQGGRPSPRLDLQRAKALDEMDKELRFGGGFTLAHVPEVERRLKIRLRALDAAGNAILPQPSKANRRWAEVKVVLHDNHGWSELPENPPANDIVEVRPFDAEYEQARAALGSRRYEAYERDLETLALAFHQRAIPRGTRVWLLGREMVTHEGLLYRAQAERAALQDAFEEAHDVRVDDLQDLAESLADVPVADRSEEQQRMCELAHAYTVSTLKIGGAGSYHFSRFRTDNGLDRTPKAYLDIWKKSQVESRVWCSGEDWGDAKLHPHRQLDMRAAYLACDTRPEVSCSDAADLVERYGFPAKAMRHAKLPATPLTATSPWVGWTGTIQLAEWRFSAAAHEQIVDAAGKHLERNDGWMTTPELRDLLESGDLEHAVGREIVYTLGKPLERLAFPAADRTLGVQLVGKCARRGNETNVVTHDANEAAHLANALGGRLMAYKAGESYLVKYEVDEPRPQFFHVRAFVLGYLNAARARMVRRFAAGDILRVCTDGIYAKAVPEEVEGLLCRDEKRIRWGQWRDKPAGYVWTGQGQAQGYRAPRAGRLSAEVANAESKADPLPQDRPQGVDMEAVPEGLTAAVLSTASFIMINGQGGCGKTFATTRMLQGRDFVVACPSNRLARRHARELGCRTATYHKLFGYNDAVKWDPEALGRKLARLPKTILWDEAGNVDKRVFGTILPELARRGIQVVFLMDEGQLPPFGNKDAPPAAYLREEWVKDEAHRLTFTRDMRSRCERLKAIKRAMWMVPTATQVEVFQREFPATPFEDALAQWHPARDYFLVSTHPMGDAVATRLLAEHARRFPDEPARVRYDGRSCPGQKIRVPGTDEFVDQVKGIVAECPLAEVSKACAKSMDWAYSGWNTVHVVQGDTIDRPGRVFILDDKLTGWTENAPYTAVSRVRYADQVVRVLPHPVDKAALSRTPEGFEAAPDLAHIERRLHAHFRVDTAQGRAIAEKPTPLYIADMIGAQKGMCACCGVRVFCQGFRMRDPQGYSIDRIDDTRGHEVGNLRICCYQCNIRHKV